MAYVGGRLQPWFDNGPTERALEKMALELGDKLLALVVFHTPIETGHLKESWKKSPVVVLVDEMGRKVHMGGVHTEVDYAPYVEYGTGLWGPKHAKYVIRPKTPDGWLHWFNPETGEDVFAKQVLHPGSPGAHMMAIAVGELEAAFGAVCEPVVKEWARAVERQNRTGIGRRHA